MNAPDVAIFLPSLAGGGAERCALNLAVALADRGFEIELVAAEAAGPLASEVPPTVGLVDLRTPSVIRSTVPLARYLRTRRPRATIALLSHANVVAVAAHRLARQRSPLLLWEHNVLSEVLADAGGVWPQVFPRVARPAYRRADVIVAVSNRAAVDLTQTLRLDRAISVIPNPVITDGMFRAARSAVDDAWLRDPALRVILGVGRLVPQKDFPTLLRAVADLRARAAGEATDVRLVILGEGPERDRLQHLITTLGLTGVARLAGHVANPYPAIAAAEVVASSSRFEGLPTVLIEALALGTPVVATDCPSGPWEILEGGRWGTLVPVGEPRALADAIGRELVGVREGVPEEAWSPYRAARSAEAFLALLSPAGSTLA